MLCMHDEEGVIFFHSKTNCMDFYMCVIYNQRESNISGKKGFILILK